MNLNLSKRFAELTNTVNHNTRPYSYPNFISDPRLVLREIMKQKNFLEFSRDKLDCPWDEDRVYWNYIHTDYILDTTGLLVKAATEWIEKEKNRKEKS